MLCYTWPNGFSLQQQQHSEQLVDRLKMPRGGVSLCVVFVWMEMEHETCYYDMDKLRTSVALVVVAACAFCSFFSEPFCLQNPALFALFPDELGGYGEGWVSGRKLAAV